MDFFELLRGPTQIPDRENVNRNAKGDMSNTSIPLEDQTRSELIGKIIQLQTLIRSKGYKIRINGALGKVSTQRLYELYGMLIEQLNKLNVIELILILEKQIQELRDFIVHDSAVIEEVNRKNELIYCSMDELKKKYAELQQQKEKLEGELLLTYGEHDNSDYHTDLQGDLRKGRESSAEKFRRSKQITGRSDTLERSTAEEGNDYVTTDIHSHYLIIEEMLKKLGPKDRLWMLGDILARHSRRAGKAIDILRDIVKRNKGDGPQIEVLLGNHDVGLIRLYEDVKKGGITSEEMRIYVNELYWVVCQDTFTPEQKRIAEKVEGILGERVSYNYETTWDDIKDFFQLSSEEQEDIYQLLKNAPYFVTIQRGEEKIALVHALPPNIEPKMGLRITDSYINALSISEDEKRDMRKWMTWGYKSGTDDFIKRKSPDYDLNEFRNVVEKEIAGRRLEDGQKQKLKQKMILDQQERGQVLDRWAAAGYKVLRGHFSQKRIMNGNLNLGELDSTFPLYCIQEGRVEYFRLVEEKEGVKVHTSNHLDALLSFDYEQV